MLQLCPGSSVHGIFQARVLEWVAIAFSEKNIYFCFIDYTKTFNCVDPNKLWKILKEMEYQSTLCASWEIYKQVKKLQLEPDMEQQTHSKLGKEYVKAVYCHPDDLTYMQITPCEMPGWMKHKLESR